MILKHVAKIIPKNMLPLHLPTLYIHCVDGHQIINSPRSSESSTEQRRPYPLVQPLVTPMNQLPTWITQTTLCYSLSYLTPSKMLFLSSPENPPSWAYISIGQRLCCSPSARGCPYPNSLSSALKP